MNWQPNMAEGDQDQGKPHSMMEIAAKEQVDMVGDGAGGFIFPIFHPGFDGMFAIANIMGLLTAANATLSDVVGSLPPYYMSSTKVSCPGSVRVG